MSAEELSQTLRKLHEELSGNPELDESTLSSLRLLLDEIQVAIDRGTGEEYKAVGPVADSTDDAADDVKEQTLPVGALPVGERLRLAIDAFEARHPSLTLSLSKIADGLSSIGI